MVIDAAFFALVSLIIFIGVALYLKLPSRIGTLLDDRSKKIAADLDAAARLREEAARLVLAEQMKDKSEEFVAQAIRDISAKLN